MPSQASTDPAYRILRHAHRGELIDLMGTSKYTLFPTPRFGAVAFIAIGIAIFGLIATCTNHPYWGILLAMVSGPLGVVGLVRALSPEIRGGFLSFIAVALSAGVVIIAVLSLIFGLPDWLAL